jgi:murein DD-endopeptidase MepM/ murein hydrolase activator NlpD
LAGRRNASAFVSGIWGGLLFAVCFLAATMSVRLLAASRGEPAVAPSDNALPVPSLPPPSAAVLPPRASDYDRLRARDLLLPVEGYERAFLRDNFHEPRSHRTHEAIDLLAPRGTRVLAADDGVIRRLSSGDRGGITIYQIDPAGEYGYYYAHLDRYAPFLREGQAVRKGDVIGFVGTTGNAPPQTPHLHFSIVKIADPARWWSGIPLNPYLLWAAG